MELIALAFSIIALVYAIINEWRLRCRYVKIEYPSVAEVWEMIDSWYTSVPLYSKGTIAANDVKLRLKYLLKQKSSKFFRQSSILRLKTECIK